MRSLTDLRNRRIYGKQESVGTHSPSAVVLQALGHFLLGHKVPRDFADFLRQRVEANYFAAAVLMPETAVVPVLQRAKQDRDLAVEDLVDLFSVSYEMAAHRFTNLATHHLGLPCHFVKNDASGVIYKAYENDGVVFPADPSGAIEGQRMRRQWAGRQVFAVANRSLPRMASTPTRRPGRTSACPRLTRAPTTGRRSRSACRSSIPCWFRGRESRRPYAILLPGRRVLPQRAPLALSERWEGMAWPSARAHSHSCRRLLVPPFPGVDDVDIYEFLDRYGDD